MASQPEQKRGGKLRREMVLPPEIQLEIVSYFIEIPCKIFPWHQDLRYQAKTFPDWDSFTYFGPSLSCSQCSVTASYTPIEESHILRLDLPSLFNLRLVSRSWNAAVTNVLQQYMWWRIDFNLRTLEETATRYTPTSAGGASSNPYTLGNSYIRRIVIGLVDDAISCERQHLPGGVWGPARNAVSNQDDIPGRCEILRNILKGLSRVEALSLCFPSAEVKDLSGYKVSNRDFDRHSPEWWIEHYNLEVVDGILAVVQDGLRSGTAFQHLVDLRLRLPSTYHMKSFAEAMSEESRKRLKSLYITTVDKTGCNAFRHFTELFYTRDDPGVIDGNKEDDGVTVPRSNVHAQYPSKEHQDQLWGFVRSCSNLECLGIEAAHPLDLDRLDWQQSPTSLGLRSLFLSGVFTSLGTILKLISPAGEGQPVLQRLVLELVKMHPLAGYWFELYRYLRKRCPQLEYVQAPPLRAAAYFTTHQNYFTAHQHHFTTRQYYLVTRQRYLTPHQLRLSLSPVIPRTPHMLDYNAHMRLRRMLQGRSGEMFFTEEDYATPPGDEVPNEGAVQ